MTSRNKIETNQPFKISVQTEDKFSPSAITIKLITYITPIVEQDYTKAVLKHSKQLKSLLYKTINKAMFDADRTILFIDTADKLMQPNKASYGSINITLYQNKPYHRMKSDRMNNELTEISELMMNELITRNEFTFTKTKNNNQ